MRALARADPPASSNWALPPSPQHQLNHRDLPAQGKRPRLSGGVPAQHRRHSCFASCFAPALQHAAPTACGLRAHAMLPRSTLETAMCRPGLPPAIPSPPLLQCNLNFKVTSNNTIDCELDQGPLHSAIKFSCDAGVSFRCCRAVLFACCRALPHCAGSSAAMPPGGGEQSPAGHCSCCSRASMTSWHGCKLGDA